MGSIDLPFEEALTRVHSSLGPLAIQVANRSAAIVQSLNQLIDANRFRPNVVAQRDYSDFSIAELTREFAAVNVDFARVLFRSWFVDFEPTFCKSQGVDPKLPPDISDLFASEFEDSPLGEIPKGWRVGLFGEVLVPVNARIGEYNAQEYSATVRGLELRELRFNKPLSQTQSKNKRIQKNDLVFGLSRKVVNFGLMTGEIGSVSPVYEIFRIRTDIYIPELLELYIRYHMRMHIDILKSGAREGAPIDRDYLLSRRF